MEIFAFSASQSCETLMRKFLRKDFGCFCKHTTVVAMSQRTKPKQKRSFLLGWLIHCPEGHGKNAALHPRSGSHVVWGVVSGVTDPIPEAALPKRVNHEGCQQSPGGAQGVRPLQWVWLLENKRRVSFYSNLFTLSELEFEVLSP